MGAAFIMSALGIFIGGGWLPLIGCSIENPPNYPSQRTRRSADVPNVQELMEAIIRPVVIIEDAADRGVRRRYK